MQIAHVSFFAAALLCVASTAQRPASEPVKQLSSPALNTLLVGVDRRPVTSLNGDWHYLVEQPPFGSLYGPGGKIRDNGYALNSHPNISSGPHNDEYDFASAPTLKVPGDWNTQVPSLFRFEGVVWYQRDFNVELKPNTRTFLHVGAANYMTHVWVNQKRICDHEGGFTPFDCEVTAAIHPGGNFVVIAVDSTRHPDDIPSVTYDWIDYGGITRDVSLVSVPQVFIDDYDVHLAKEPTFSTASANRITGYVHVLDAPAGTRVSIKIPEAGVSISATVDSSGKAPFDVRANSLTLWSPEHPRLYAVTLATGADSLPEQIGFRDIRVDGTRILLNGQAVFLQGANAHAEAPIRTGRVDDDQDVSRIFAYLHEMNANFVRLCHYPHDERMTRMADKSGVMVWSEIPLWQRISFDKPEVYAKATFMLNEMVRRDRNKASIIMWSVSNETPNNPARTFFLTNLANEARRLDQTRPITSALIGPRIDGKQVVQDDPLAAALDIVGQNEYLGWYVGNAEDADTTEWSFPQKPIIMSEFGAEAKQGNHGGAHDRWTEEQQANVFRHQFVMFNKIPQLRGLTPWVLADFRSPGRNIPKLQDGFNRKGLISEDGKKKQAFYMFQKIYKERLVGKAE